jgi:hypothetical protein
MASANRFHPVLSDEEAGELYQHIQRVAGIVFEYFRPDVKADVSMEDRRHNPPVSIRGVTSNGLYMVIELQTPRTLWTPWGEWSFGGGSHSRANYNHEEVADAAMARFEAVPAPEYSEAGKRVFALYAVDGVRLPEPRMAGPSPLLGVPELDDGWQRLIATVGS